jgi:enamine deaminase RidA (YjgF/YER057c/UK114 family)
MMKETLSPLLLFDSKQFGFSQVVISDPGKMVFISGQVAWDDKLKIIGKKDLAMQTQKSLDNIKIAIEAAGGTLDDIVMLRIYKVNYRKKDGAIISQILKNNFGVENPPASTWLNVKGLANKKFMIEIEAQAVI